MGLPRAAGRGRGGEGARHHEQARDRGLRDRGVQPAVPRVGAALRRGLVGADGSHRDVDRYRRRVLDPRQRVHRERLVANPADVGPRPRLRGLQGRPVLRSLRHRVVEPRAGPAGRIPGRDGALGLRPVPRDRRRLRPSRVDDHALDARLERRRRGRARDRIRAREGTRRRARPRPRRDARRRRARRGRRARRAGPRVRSRRPPVRAAVRIPADRSRRQPGRDRRLRHRRRRVGDRPPRARVR